MAFLLQGSNLLLQLKNATALRNGFGALASSDIRLLGPQKLLKLRERPARGLMLDATAARKPLNVLPPQVGDALLAPSLQVLEHAQHAVVVHGALRNEASRCDGGTVRVLLEFEYDPVTNVDQARCEQPW